MATLTNTVTQEHLVQWHPTILSKLALVPQRTFASYSRPTLGEQYQEGDFVAMFPGCARTGRESCEVESGQFWGKWKASFGLGRRKHGDGTSDFQGRRR